MYYSSNVVQRDLVNNIKQNYVFVNLQKFPFTFGFKKT